MTTDNHCGAKLIKCQKHNQKEIVHEVPTSQSEDKSLLRYGAV
jgi:hypothetical protein